MQIYIIVNLLPNILTLFNNIMSKPNLSILREIAKNQNISLKKISEELDISPAALQNIMRNNGTSLITLGKLAEILNVSVGVFFGEENKSEKILAIFDNVLADDKKRADDVVNAVMLAEKTFAQMGATNDPILKKKLIEFQQKQLEGTLGNKYMQLLFDMDSKDLKQLVTLGYISDDLYSLIDLAQKELNPTLQKKKNLDKV